MFCSQQCLDEALATYHGVEGPISRIITTSGLKKSEWLLGFRAITQKPLKFFTKEAKAMMSSHDPKHGLENDGGKYFEWNAVSS